MMRLFSFMAACAIAGSVQAESYPESSAIVSVGGPITEIIYALGAEDRLVARDTTSVFPPAANALPDVGYMRKLSAEGVLSVSPDLIVARATSGPPEALEQLAASSVPVVLVEDQFTKEAVAASVLTVGEAIGETEKAEALAGQISSDFAALDADLAAVAGKKRVMFVLSMDGGRLNAAGAGTGANGIITLAGAENVFADQFQSYKLVDAEAVIKAAPEVIIMMTGRGDHTLKAQQLWGIPAVALTPAGQAKALHHVPGAALGFGPRTATFARDLHDALYAQAAE